MHKNFSLLYSISSTELHELYDKDDINKPCWTPLNATPEKLDNGCYRFNLHHKNYRPYYPQDTYEH
ncbi:MAG: hypothetical protein H3C48_11810 [Chitinophagaceae bacterium]|nr:hypothetical protein [Chitinophagaceae bacterium]